MEILNVDKKDNLCIIRFSGELTLETVEKMKSETEEYLSKEDCPVLVMDLSKTHFLDSSGIGFLVYLNNKNKKENKTFYILSPSPQVKKTLSLVKLIDYFNILEDESQLDSLTA